MVIQKTVWGEARSNSKDSPIAALIAMQVSYQNIPRQRNKDKRPSLQERQAQEYSFSQENMRELLEELPKHNILMLPEIKCLDQVEHTNNPR